MPPPQRIPALPGATQATKKAFKPPARVASDTSVDTTEPKVKARPAINKGAAKFSRANPNASRPSVSADSSRAGSAAPKAARSKTAARTTAATGFTRATDVRDIEMISSDDGDFDDDLEAALSTTAAKAAETHPDASHTIDTVNMGTKRKRLSRLPSLSISSSESIRALSPIEMENARQSPVTHEYEDETAHIGTESDEVPLLPAPLLTRLLHESFDDKQMKISKDANALMGRYLDVFVREAVARAALAQKERKGNDESVTHDDMDADIWLDTRDLEEVAPGLVLDF